MYQLAGESGVIKSWHRLGQVYETDQPFSPKDIEKAVEWYIKAAEQKYLPSIKRLTRLKRLPEELAPK
jgi:TPR repeat protein